MAILQATDFESGEYSVPQNNFTDLQSYIVKYEKIYLRKLLGVDLYTLFIADLTPTTPQVPQTQIYLDIFNPIAQNNNGSELVNEGMKAMLIQFIYFHYMREKRYQKTMSGVNAQASENGVDLNYIGWNILDAYNCAIGNGNVINCYINDNITTYPTFNGYYFMPISGY